MVTLQKIHASLFVCCAFGKKLNKSFQILNEYSPDDKIGHQNQQPVKPISYQNDSQSNLCKSETLTVYNATKFSKVI